MGEAYVKLFKKMLDWEWYDDSNTCRLFIHCLLKANWKSGSWHGIDYEPGQFITSLTTLSNETHLTVKQVRTALNHLKATGEVADQRQGNCRIITVNNWNLYQAEGNPVGKPRANQGQTKGKQGATDKEYKEYKEGNNKYICAFDEWWECYPRKKDKSRAYANYKARLNDGYTKEQLLTACKNYAEECRKNKTEEKYIKHGATFLSVNEPFLDYLKGENNGSGNTSDCGTDEEQRNREIDRFIDSDEYRNNDERPFT
ncbi:MAG: hypothetical protein E7396_10005 [Ruminococcaceae bacterium]|nr:hypothetical protein [Oscillospiraceae bacterium]